MTPCGDRGGGPRSAACAGATSRPWPTPAGPGSPTCPPADRPGPGWARRMPVVACRPDGEARIAFSGLDASVAGSIEEEYASAGAAVVSNSRNHRMDADVPLLVAEVNADHLDLVAEQRRRR